MKKILFVCTGNTCRSPMAEIIFNSICAERSLPYKGESAGVCTISGLPMSENSKAVLEKAGYSTDGFASTDISDVNFEDYDLFAVMAPSHGLSLLQYGVPHEKIYVFALEQGGIYDPYGMSEGTYELCRDEIKVESEKLADWLGEKYGD